MATKKRGRGRPRKGSADAKTESVVLRLDAREKQGFTDAAKLAGAPLSVWMRVRLRALAMRELGDAGRDVPFLK